MNGSMITGYAKKGVTAAKQMAQHAPGQVGRAAVLLSAGPMAYLREVLRSQQQANAQYGNMPLIELAGRLRGWGSSHE